MTRMNIRKWISENKVIVVLLPLIFGIHLGWWKLQQNKVLVDPAEKRDLPIFTMYKGLKQKVLGENLSGSIEK